MKKEKSRYIRKHVRELLSKQIRDRCCLCEEVLIPQKVRILPFIRKLQYHHLIPFSGSGPNSANNLLPVCANCHAKIHSQKPYPVKELIDKKKHWMGMKDIVPKRLSYDPEGNYSKIELVTLPFLLESLNLDYLITAPCNIKVSQLCGFILRSIIMPLSQYGKREWVDARKVALSLLSSPDTELNTDESLSNIGLAKGDSLIALIEVKTVAVQVSEHGNALSSIPEFYDLFKKVLIEDIEKGLLNFAIENCTSILKTDSYSKDDKVNACSDFWSIAIQRVIGHIEETHTIEIREYKDLNNLVAGPRRKDFDAFVHGCYRGVSSKYSRRQDEDDPLSALLLTRGLKLNLYEDAIKSFERDTRSTRALANSTAELLGLYVNIWPKVSKFY